MKKLTTPILLISAATDAANVLYRTGFSAVDPVVFLEKPDGRYLVVPALEFGLAREKARATRVLTPAALPIALEERRKLSGWCLGLLHLLEIKRVAVSAVFPLGVAEQLRQQGIGISVAGDPLYHERQIKSAAEIKKLRNVQTVAAHAVNRAIAVIAQASITKQRRLRWRGRTLTSEIVKHEIDQMLLAHDCVARDTIVAGGAQGVNPHERGSGPLRAGEPIVIDIFPQHREHKYWGDITRTVVRGKASDAQWRMFRAVREAQRAALAKVKAGVKVSVVHKTVEGVFRQQGFETTIRPNRAEGFIHSTGHGIGLETHEAPSVRDAETKLEQGQVVTIEPGLYYHALGGVRIEDTIVVRARGWEPLATCAIRFEV